MNLVERFPMATPRFHIKDWIRDNRSSQTKLGEAIGVKQQAIAAFISGKTDRLKKLPELAKHMRVTTDWLLYGVIHKDDKTIPTGNSLGQDILGVDERGRHPMGDAKATLIRQVLDMTDEEAANLSQFLASREGKIAHPSKRGRA